MKNFKLVSVSTIHDNKKNITFFIENNRKSGVDHFFIFLETSNSDVIDYLDTLPFVTTIPSYNMKKSHDNLNPRQEHNATIINDYLSQQNDNFWLTHIDGDEVIHIDKEKLFSLPEDIKQVNMQPAEPIISTCFNSKYIDGWFKCKLSPEKLHLCYAFDFINEPRNTKWLRGYLNQKVIVRVKEGLKLNIHNSSYNKEEKRVIPGFYVKHYESTDEDEFVRKWLAKRINSKGNTGARFERAVLRDSIDCIVSLNLTEERKKELLKELYKKTFCESHVDLKVELGLFNYLINKENPATDKLKFEKSVLIRKYKNSIS